MALMESLPVVALDDKVYNQMDVDQLTKPLQKLPAPPPGLPEGAPFPAWGQLLPTLFFTRREMILRQSFPYFSHLPEM